tara:strand:+ start:753 stop:1067 length:315 start_codon:yes stop_codon:yes gene_type:complete
MHALSCQVLATLWLGKTGVLPHRFSANRLGNVALSFEDRIKDMLKVDGKNVGAAEVERLILSAPNVGRLNALNASFIRSLQVALRQPYDPQSGGNHTRPIAPGS